MPLPLRLSTKPSRGIEKNRSDRFFAFSAEAKQAYRLRQTVFFLRSLCLHVIDKRLPVFTAAQVRRMRRAQRRLSFGIEF